LRTSVQILIVDDHPVMRFGIAQLIAPHADLRVCGEAESASEAVHRATALQPDLILVDLSLKDRSGLALLRMLREVVPKAALLVVSMHDESLFAERALRAGARGYVMKDESGDTLIGAIRQVLGGRTYVSDRMAQALLARLGHDDMPPPGGALATLTDRELEVFELIGRALGTAAIAARLGVSVKTVETHRANIKTKLGIEDSTELLRHAIAWSIFV
jgi:DNA-binding NarL/FixJ family response regulator